eukprot:g5931.t1
MVFVFHHQHHHSPDSQFSSLFFIGIGLSLLGSVGDAAGLCIQKLAHVRNENSPIERQRPYVQLPLWRVGFSIFVVAEICQAVALGFLPQACVASLGCLCLVWNLFFAFILIGEKPVTQDYIGVCVIIMGSILAVFFYSAKPRTNVTPTTMLLLSERPLFRFVSCILLFIAFLCVALITHSSIRRLLCLKFSDQSSNEAGRSDERTKIFPSIEKGKAKVQSYSKVINSNLELGKEEEENTKLLHLNDEVDNQVLAVLYSILCAVCGTLSVSMTKVFCTLTRAALTHKHHKGEGHNYSHFSFSLFTCITFIMFGAVLSVHFSNKALVLGNALLVVPLQYVLSMILKVVVGMIFYEDYQVMSQTQLFAFTLGVMANLSGVLLLSKKEESGGEIDENEKVEEIETEILTEAKKAGSPLSKKNAREMAKARWRLYKTTHQSIFAWKTYYKAWDKDAYRNSSFSQDSERKWSVAVHGLGHA